MCPLTAVERGGGYICNASPNPTLKSNKLLSIMDHLTTL